MCELASGSNRRVLRLAEGERESWTIEVRFLARGHTRVDFLIQRLPEGLKAALNWLAMFSLAGLPPTVGFYGKLVVLQAAVAAGYFCREC